MKTYRALVTLPRIGQTPVTIEARSTYEAKEKLEAQYGKGNVTNRTRCERDFVMPTYDDSDAASGFTIDEAQWLAVNIAQLPEPMRRAAAGGSP